MRVVARCRARSRSWRLDRRSVTYLARRVAANPRRARTRGAAAHRDADVTSARRGQHRPQPSLADLLEGDAATDGQPQPGGPTGRLVSTMIFGARLAAGRARADAPALAARDRTVRAT